MANNDQPCLDNYLNQMHRCVAIMDNLSKRPETDLTQKIYEMCQQTIVDISQCYTQVQTIAKLYLIPQTLSQFKEAISLHPTKHTEAYRSRVDDIVLILLSELPEDSLLSLEERFVKYVIREGE